MDLSLFAFIGVCFLAALSGALFQPGAWYEALKKPVWRPPNWVFGPVWTVLYGMIAFAGWRVWQAAGPGEATVPMIVYGVQLVLNFAWSWVMFGLRRIGWALVEIGALWLSILATILVFYPIDAAAAWMLLPYLAWASFAAVLNAAVWRRNRDRPPGGVAEGLGR
ncbi:MAG: TspO/MBR family protein [Pseudomonadota bacterium]